MNLNELDPRVIAAYRKMFTYVPHAKQELFHKSHHLIKAFIGETRSGKSIGGVMEMLWWLTGTHPFLDTPTPPVYARSVTPDLKRTTFGVLIPYYKEFGGGIPGPLIRDFSTDFMRMTFTNGSEVEFMSYEQDIDKFGGRRLHIIHFDEQPREDIFDECLRRTVDFDGRVIMTFTPQITDGLLHWSYDKIYENTKKDQNQIRFWMKYGKSREEATMLADPLVYIIRCKTQENPHVDQEALSNVRTILGEDTGEGDFFRKSAMIFQGYFIEEINTRQPEELPDWNTLTICLGIDPQERNPTAAVICGIDRYNRLWVLGEWYEYGLVSEHAAGIKNLLSGFKPAYGVIDHNASIPSSVAGRSIKDEYQRHGLHLVPAKKGHNSVLEGIGQMKKLFQEQQILISRSCPNLIRQLNRYTWDSFARHTRDKKDPKERPVKKDDHLVDALRYVCMYGHGPKWRDPATSSPHQPTKNRPPLSSKTGY